MERPSNSTELQQSSFSLVGRAWHAWVVQLPRLGERYWLIGTKHESLSYTSWSFGYFFAQCSYHRCYSTGITAQSHYADVTAVAQIAPRHNTYIISRACHVTSHRVFLWDHTAFNTLLSLFTLGDSHCRAVRHAHSRHRLVLQTIFLSCMERTRLRMLMQIHLHLCRNFSIDFTERCSHMMLQLRTLC